MDEKLKALLDKARSGGATADQLREIISTYKAAANADVPKKETVEEENGELESPSANTVSLSDSSQTKTLAEQVDAGEIDTTYNPDPEGILEAKEDRKLEEFDFSEESWKKVKANTNTALAGLAGLPSFMNKTMVTMIASDDELEVINSLDPQAREAFVNGLFHSPSGTPISGVAQIGAEAQEELNAKAAKIQSTITQFESNIVDDLGNGDFMKAGLRIGSEGIGSIPSILQAMIPYVGIGSIVAGSASNKQEELEDEGYGLGGDTSTNAIVNGAAEGLLEIVTKKMGKKLFKSLSGADAAVTQTVMQGLKENLLKAPLKEGASEAATGAIQNLSDALIQGKEVDFNTAFKEVVDAGLIGMATGGAMGGATQVSQQIGRLKDDIAITKVITDENNSYKSIKDVFIPTGQANFNLDQLKVASRNDAFNILRKDLDKAVKTGEITEEQAGLYERRLAESVNSLSKTKGVKMTDDNRVKASNLIQRKEKLKEEVKTLDDAVALPKKEQIAKIDEQLLGLINYDKEATTSTKTKPTADTGKTETKTNEGANKTESKEKVISEDNSSNYANLTEEGDDFVFFHQGGKGYKEIKTSTGGTPVTSSEESGALSKVGGMAMYYTNPDQSERQTASDSKYAVKVPKDKVYDFNSDPSNFIEEARRRHTEEHPDKAFDANTQVAYVSQIAGENGYDMVVSEWRDGQTRAQTTKALKPSDVRNLDGNVITKDFDNTYEGNNNKGYESVIPEAKQTKLKKAYDAANKEKNKKEKYDELYHLKDDSDKYSQEEITQLIESSDLSDSVKEQYREALAYEPANRSSRIVEKTGNTVVEDAPKGTFINVGLKEGQTNKDFDISVVKENLPDDVEVIEAKEVTGTERTASIQLSRPLTDLEMKTLLAATKQLAIPQISDGNGVMFGTKEWGDFNPEFFVMPNDKKLTDTIKDESDKKTSNKDTKLPRSKESGKKETSGSPDGDVQPSISEIEKIDLSESTGLNKVLSILDKLDNDLGNFGKETLGMNLPVAVARGAVKAMKVAAKTAKVGADITSAGLNFVTGTKWYKGLNKADKDEFHKKGLINKLNAVEAEMRKAYPYVKDPSVKKTIRENTGQIDMSRKQLISESKLLKEQLKNLARGAKLGAKHINNFKNEFVNQLRTVTKGMGKDMNNSEIDQLLNKARKVTEKNVSEIVEETNRILERVEKRLEKKKYNSTLKGLVKKAIKVQKKKIGNIGQNIIELSRIRPESIPEAQLEEYFNVMKEVSQGKYDKARVDALYDSLRDDIIADVDLRNKEKEDRQVKEEKDTTELLVDANKAIRSLNSSDTSLLSKAEKLVLRKLKALPKAFLDTLPAKKLNDIINDLETLSEYGYLPNKNISSIVVFAEGVDIANEIKGKVGEKMLHVSSGLFQELDRLYGKGKQETGDMIERFQNKMGQHTDALIKGVKGTMFYENIIHPISSGLQTATEKTLETGGKLEALLDKAKIDGKFDFNVKLQLLFRASEANANPVFKGSKVFSVKEHIDATNALHKEGKSQYSDSSIETINTIFNEFADSSGNIDLAKLEESFTPAEMKVIKFIKKNLLDTANSRKDLDSNMLGENTLILEDYFPRKNDSGAKKKGGFVDYIKKTFNSSSVKPQAANQRKVNSANALDFTTLSHFMGHVKETNVESHISPAMKRVGIVLSQLKDSDNTSLVKVSMALENSVNKLVDIHMGKNIYATKSKNDKLIQVLLSKTFNKMLMSNTRAVIDNISQNATLFLTNADRLGDIRKSRLAMGKVSTTIMDEYSSTQRERIGGNRAADFQEGMSSELTKAKWSKKDPSKSDKAIDLLNKNKLSELGDKYAKAYYQVVDFSAKFFWDYHFMNSFEKSTGEKFDPKKYKFDPDYKVTYDKQIRQSVARTDKQISNIYNTGAQSEQKLKVQIGSKNRDFKTRINSFMQSFAFNENSVWWDSLMSTLGKEGGTMDSKKEAFRTFMTVNIRSVGYGYLSMTLFDSIAAAMGLIEDDEELEEKAMKRSLAQHGMLIAFGNKGSIFNMAAAYIFENWIHKNVVKSQGGTYNGYEDSLLYAQQERASLKSHLGMLGAEGQLMQSFMDIGELSVKLLAEYDKEGTVSEDNLVKYKALKISITSLAQLTGLPIDRLGKQVQKMMSFVLETKKASDKKLLKIK
jgi:hypothetical protein